MSDIPAQISIEMENGAVLRDVTVFAGTSSVERQDIYNPVVIFAAAKNVGVKISFANRTAARDMARQILQSLGDIR